MRLKLLVLATVIQLITALASVFTLVPRVRLVEAVTVFATAFGAGATFVGGVIEIRKERRSR